MNKFKFLINLVIVFSAIISIQATANTGASSKKNTQQEQVSTATTALTPQQEVVELFDATNPRTSITVNGKVLHQTSSKGVTKVFAGASETDVKTYFTTLTGKPLPTPRVIPNKGQMYVTLTADGSFNLREFSSSVNTTGSVWTIDIPKSFSKTVKNAEIKFTR